jgi:CRISPR-associated endonuclease/helicase Cas3
MTAYAHTLKGHPPSEWEPLSQHLDEVAATAAKFASCFGCAQWGFTLGLCHDLGKFSDAFQDYLRKVGQDAGIEEEEELSTGAKRVDHSTYGARLVHEQFKGPIGQMLAFCLMGHHTGLPDAVRNEGAGLRTTLLYKLNPDSYPIPVVEAPKRPFPKLAFSLQRTVGLEAFQCAFRTRMLFSSLIDADRTCTERFCNPDGSEERRRHAQSRPTLAAMKAMLDEGLDIKQKEAAATEVNRQRSVVLAHCREAAGLSPGFFSLNVPTGGGKTLASLAFALEHATRPSHDLRRVVVAIPYTSIIEQTADTYRQVLGSMAESAIVEHHTNLQPRHDTRTNQLGTENWDAPLIVTTNVQMLESLFAYRTTPCRKLHNLAKSVIVLDEAQSIPVELFHNYGCTIVLCTATQPALERRNDFEIGLQDVRSIIPDALPLFNSLKRVVVHRIGKRTDERLALDLTQQQSALCIVNTRKHAARLYDKIAASSPSGECFHLSTLMCGAHRREVLRTIRERLREGQPCRVVSTQLIEAGVDLDFPIVYRAETGFDSIAQAAGRCNREGALSMGHTYVFEAEERPPQGLLRTAADKAAELYERYPDPLDPKAVEAYFSLFYWEKKAEWDKHNVMKTVSVDRIRGILDFQFREMAQAFKIIRDDQLPLLIPYSAKPDADNEPWSKLAANHIRFWPQRELQPYLVSLPKYAVQQMQGERYVTEHESGFWILQQKQLYSREKGLTPEAKTTLDASLWGV